MKANRVKFLIGGILIAVAVLLLVLSVTRSTAEFFLTVAELQSSDEYRPGQNLRVSGAVLGDSIVFNTVTGLLEFTLAHIPADEDLIDSPDGLALALHQAVNDPQSPRLDVRYAGAPPDMLRDEAQAIVTGQLNHEGIFIAEELLLKCPSKYEEALPQQVE